MKRFASAAAIWITLTASVFAAGKPVTDDYLTDAVRSRLAQDPIVKGGNIEVDVKDGNVVLKGKVEELKQRDRAEKVTKKVPGVKSVKNDLQLAHP